MTYDFRSLQRLKHLCAFGAFVLGCLHSFQVGAVTAPDSAYNRFYSLVTAPGVQTVSFASSGSPLVMSGATTLTSDGAAPFVRGTGSLPLPGGVRLPITTAAKVPNSTIASMVKKALPYARTATNPLALTLLAIELGFALTTSDTGEPTLTKKDLTGISCTVAPCPVYTFFAYPAVAAKYSYASACEALYTWAKANQTSYVYDTGTYPNVSWNVTSGNLYCSVVRTQAGAGASILALFTTGSSAVPQVAPTVSATAEQFADAIAAKSGWPSSSAVSQALVDAAKTTGTTIESEQPTISGPATVVGPVETTSVPATPSTPYKDMTKSTNYNCTYVQGATVMDGGKAICTAKTTTTEAVRTVDPVTGATTTTTTTASEATKPAEIQPDDKPAEDPCIKNPTRNGCRSDDFDVPTDAIPKTSKTITYAAENLGFAGGSCPANVVMTPRGMSKPLTVINWVENCNKLTTYAKPMILALATFAALMIIFIGKPE